MVGRLALGIDFGTSTTVAAALGLAGAPRIPAHILEDENGTRVTPSVVAFAPSGTVFVGEKARARRLMDPSNTIYSIKRILGRGWFSAELSEFRRRYPFTLEKSGEGAVVVTRAGKLAPSDIAAHLFVHLRKFYPLSQHAPTAVVITVPASFNEQQRRAVIAAAEKGGFSAVQVVEEPLSALMAYGGDQRLGKHVVVYDLGGGTFDLSVLVRAADGYNVLASGGDDYLGGDDIDQQCATWASEQILRSYGWDVSTSPAAFQGLVFACERAKIRLAEVDETVIPLGQVEPSLQGRDLRLNRTVFRGIISQLVRRTFVACDEVLGRAGVSVRSVDTVVLAGGGSYSPMVQADVAAYFGRQPLVSLAPDQIVAVGAARYAHSGAQLWQSA